MNSHARQARYSSRRVTATAVVLVVAAVIAAVSLLDSRHDGLSSEAVAAGLPNATRSNTTGNLTDLDKTFLTKVRQAGLWEIPAGRLAQTHASSEAVKRAGMHLLDGHSKLDQLVREDARGLGVPIPDQATPEQQAWVRQLENAQGLQFDQLFVDLLRNSHGKVFIVIGEVRATTKNPLVRRLATQANDTVQDHMEVLEDTGLVTDATLEDVASSIPH
ncbi:DUF4142 domain-containing protein [Actinacidiphila sp. bgisy160]|uniref:DUF4142 domain-containing protein n=1 Tax=Actinacidiphila sp. bgisy160 TaxID=3413796 RepID=UPI003D72DE81